MLKTNYDSAFKSEISTSKTQVEALLLSHFAAAAESHKSPVWKNPNTYSFAFVFSSSDIIWKTPHPCSRIHLTKEPVSSAEKAIKRSLPSAPNASAPPAAGWLQRPPQPRRSAGPQLPAAGPELPAAGPGRSPLRRRLVPAGASCVVVWSEGRLREGPGSLPARGLASRLGILPERHTALLLLTAEGGKIWKKKPAFFKSVCRRQLKTGAKPKESVFAYLKASSWPEKLSSKKT